MTSRLNITAVLVTVVFVFCATLPMAAAAGSGVSESWLQRARAAASEDDHEKAVEYYERAVALNPSTKHAVANEIGLQYTWMEQPDRAIEWFDVALLKDPDNKEVRLNRARALSWSGELRKAADEYRAIAAEPSKHQLRARLGLARVNAWQGNLGEAARLYREILDEQPANAEAQMGLAEVTNWSGRHREASGRYRRIVNTQPDNIEAFTGLSYAQYWSGDTHGALSTLGSAPVHPDVERARADIDGTGRVRGFNEYTFRDNSSDGDLQSLETRVGIGLNEVTEIGASYTRTRLRQSGFPNVNRDQLLGHLQRRLSRSVALTASGGLQWYDFDTVTLPSGPVADGFNPFVWDVYATVTPADWVRLDFGNNNRVLDIPRTIFQELIVNATAASLDWRLNPRDITYWKVSFADYSDTNSRWSFSFRNDWNVPHPLPTRNHTTLLLQTGFEYSDFRLQGDNGYFSPNDYKYLYGGLRWRQVLSRRFTLELGGRYGAEREGGGDWLSSGSLDGNLQINIDPGAILRVGYQGSGSRLDSEEGFRSKRFYVSIDYPLSR